MTIACMLLLTAPRLVAGNGVLRPTSLTVQGTRCVATFDASSETSTVVFEVDVETGRMSRRKIAGKGWVFSQRGNEVVAVQMPSFRFEPPKPALASARWRRDVLDLGDSTVLVFDNRLIALKEDQVLWTMEGKVNWWALGGTGDGKGFFVLGDKDGRETLRWFDAKGTEVSEGVNLPSTVHRVGYPFLSVCPLDDDHVVTYVSYTDEYYAAHPMRTVGLGSVPEQDAPKEFGYLFSVVRLDVRTGEMEEAGRFAIPYNWHYFPLRGTLAARGGMAYAWLLGELYEFDFRRR